jgi:hypothetical protein
MTDTGHAPDQPIAVAEGELSEVNRTIVHPSGLSESGTSPTWWRQVGGLLSEVEPTTLQLAGQAQFDPKPPFVSPRSYSTPELDMMRGLTAQRLLKMIGILYALLSAALFG